MTQRISKRYGGLSKTSKVGISFNKNINIKPLESPHARFIPAMQGHHASESNEC